MSYTKKIRKLTPNILVRDLQLALIYPVRKEAKKSIHK